MIEESVNDFTVSKEENVSQEMESYESMSVSSQHSSQYSLGLAESCPSQGEGHMHSSPHDAVKHTAEFVLALRQGHHLSQSAMSMVIENTEILIKNTLSIMETQLTVVLQEKGLDPEEVVGDGDLFQNVMPSFEGVSTVSKQRHYFLQNWSFGKLATHVCMHANLLRDRCMYKITSMQVFHIASV